MIILNFKYNIILLVKKIIMKEFIDNIKKCINYIIDKIKELKEEFEGRKRYWLMYQDHEWWFNRNPYRTTKKQRRKAEYERSLTNSQKRLRLARRIVYSFLGICLLLLILFILGAVLLDFLIGWILDIPRPPSKKK